MKVGILYEGEYDQEPFSILLTRIVKGINSQTHLSIDRYPANGSISSKVEEALKLFFEIDKPCELAVFINDMDNVEDRCKSIKRRVNIYKQKNPNIKIFVLCPNPSFEIWFFEEEAALKKVLNLPMDKEIPYANLEPKARLKKLIFELNDDYTKSKMDIYKEIAENINIQSLIMRNTEFKKFYAEFI